MAWVIGFMIFAVVLASAVVIVVARTSGDAPVKEPRSRIAARSTSRTGSAPLHSRVPVQAWPLGEEQAREPEQSLDKQEVARGVTETPTSTPPGAVPPPAQSPQGEDRAAKKGVAA